VTFITLYLCWQVLAVRWLVLQVGRS